MPGIEYEITFADGSQKSGKLDGTGKVSVEKLSPGPCTIKYKNLHGEIEIKESSASIQEQEISEDAEKEDRLISITSANSNEDDGD